MSGPRETDPVLSYLESTFGLSFSGPRRTGLLSTVERERSSMGLTVPEMLAAVSRPGRALDRLVAAVTVGETYFFRDRMQCDLLRHVALPEVLSEAAEQRPLTMWSAGCASGEETYTLAALAQEAAAQRECLVVGSDASAKAIDKARQATYGSWSLRGVARDELTSHFREQDGRWQVSDALRRRTAFVQRNLLDGPPPPGRFDVVLCRNLLIYLTRDAIRRAAHVLAGSLRPGGWLLTAAGDPPLAAEGLDAVRTPFGLAYRRLPARPLPAEPTPASPRRPAAPPAQARAQNRPRRNAPPTETHSAGAQTAAEPGPSDLAEQIRRLGDAGQTNQALRAAAGAVATFPLDVELRYLLGVVLLEAGQLQDAASAATAAAYLDPRQPAVHVLLGQVEHARGNTERARRSFRTCSRLLAASPEGEPVQLARDLTSGQLADVATRYLIAGQAR